MRQVHIGDGEVVAVGNSATLIEVHDLGDDVSLDSSEVWVPHSQFGDDDGDIDENSDVGETGSVYVTTWLAEQRGWL